MSCKEEIKESMKEAIKEPIKESIKEPIKESIKESINKETISILLACDNNYAQHAAVVAVSILIHTKKPDLVKLYLLDDGITDENRHRIEKSVTSAGGQITFITITPEALSGVFVSDHISRAAYFRLLMGELLPEKLKRVIYLDTDTVVLDDIAGLWQTDLGGKPLGAVPDLGILSSARSQQEKHDSIGLLPGQAYFNSGVLLVDLARWRSEQIGEKTLQAVLTHHYRHHDQDGLNAVLMNNWQALPVRWNVIPPVSVLAPKIYFRRELRQAAVEAKRSPALIHWAGRYKPWEFKRYEAFNGVYYDCLRQTAFAGAPMPQLSRNMKGKSIYRQLARLKIADWLV